MNEPLIWLLLAVAFIVAGIVFFATRPVKKTVISTPYYGSDAQARSIPRRPIVVGGRPANAQPRSMHRRDDDVHYPINSAALSDNAFAYDHSPQNSHPVSGGSDISFGGSHSSFGGDSGGSSGGGGDGGGGGGD